MKSKLNLAILASIFLPLISISEELSDVLKDAYKFYPDIEKSKTTHEFLNNFARLKFLPHGYVNNNNSQFKVSSFSSAVTFFPTSISH